jgi:ABC-type multidrug transport system fused ATPase/permease subunit/tRNA A-37 threonylcarbamoyl transferase component Bud32
MARRDRRGEPRRDGVRYLVRLFSRNLPGQRRLVLSAALMLALEAGAAVLEAYPLAYLIDYLKGDRAGITWFGDSRAATVAALCTGIVALAAVNSLCDSLAEIFLAKGGRVLGFNLRTRLFAQLQRLSLSYHDRRRTGDVVARVTGDVDALEDFVIKSFSDIVGSILLLVFTLAFLGVRSWLMFVMALTIVPVVSFVSQFFSKRIRHSTKELRSLDGQVATAAQEMLSSIRVIQTYGMAGYELDRFEQHNTRRVRSAMRAAILQAEFSWVVKVLEALAICALVVVGLELVDRGTLTVGMLVMFILLIQNMFKPTRKLIKEWGTIGKVLACSERVGELLDRPATVTDRADAVVAPPLEGTIEFDHVTFAYTAESPEAGLDSGPPPVALDDVSFRIEAGQVVALIGHTGAGKSTVLQLLPRLYDPQEGRVLLDGHDVRDFTLQSLRDRISVVLQETVLFSGTVAENIAYGRTDATRDEIVEAARRANAHEFIERLAEGYDTMLGERGANLSGGQRQRIAIARAFIRDTPIVLLDEPTTGLDAESAGLVLQALHTLMRGKTTVIVSHDLRLIRNSDSILVIDRGRIVQQGDHRTLLEAGGLYARLHGSSLEGIDTAGPDRDGEDSASDPGDAGVLDLDLGFERALPALATALDGELMAERIAVSMFDPATTEVLACEAGKAAATADGGCTLRYLVRVRPAPLSGLGDGGERTLIVLGRVFTDTEAAHAAYAERVVPLIGEAVDHPAIAPFEQPAVVFDDLAMVLAAFPLDIELPSLVAVTDPTVMRSVFRQVQSYDDRNLWVESVEATPGHYGRQHRCVVRYDLTARHRPSDTLEQVTVWGKTARDDVGAWTRTALEAVAAQRRVDDTDIAIPGVVLHDPDLKLIVLESVAGEPWFSRVLTAELTGKPTEIPDGTPDSDRMVEHAARVAALLHSTSVELGRRTTVADVAASLGSQLDPLEPLSPGLAEWLRAALADAVAVLESEPGRPETLVHGDFTHTQLLFDGDTPGLIDFDTVTLADPCVDLGHFRAYLRLAVAKATAGGDTTRAGVLCDAFLERYGTETGLDPASIDRLVRAWELVSLVRIAVHSWHKVKAERLALCLPLVRAAATDLTGRDPGLPLEARGALR